MGGRRKTQLERRRLSRVYARRLEKCRAHLDRWDLGEGAQLEGLLKDPPALDAYLARYLDDAHRSGLPVYLPKHAVLHVQFECRELQHRLPRTWDSIRAWE